MFKMIQKKPDMTATASNARRLSIHENKKKNAKSSDSTRTASITNNEGKNTNHKQDKAVIPEPVINSIPTTPATAVDKNNQLDSTSRKKRKSIAPEEPSDSVKRIALKAGYTCKEGGIEGIGCQHYTMAQMRPYAICTKASRDYYMAEGRFLHNRGCTNCEKEADKIDMVKTKLKPDNAFIIYCNFGVQRSEGKKKTQPEAVVNETSTPDKVGKKALPKLCHWYCGACYIEGRDKEALEVGLLNGSKRPKRLCKAG
jgi:hypothetical protein